MGASEHFGARVRVYRLDEDEPLVFGLSKAGFTGGAVPFAGGTDLESLAWSRSIGRDADRGAAGRMSFVLPGREDGMTGRPWSELISPCDYVELDVYCHRYPEPEANGSTPWRTDFTGFVDDLSLALSATEGGKELTVVSCVDQMGTLDFEHYSYWRNVGAVFGASGNAGTVDILQALEEEGFTRMDLALNSIAGAADVLFRSMLYGRLGFEREVRGETYRWEDLHGYRFESDDFGVSVDLQSLAPEGSSWMDAVSWAIDAPGFYEFYLDNVSEAGATRKLRNGGVTDVGQSTQVRTKEQGVELLGDRKETFIIRPLPFPTYSPEGGYQSAAWDSLPTVEALAFGTVTADTRRTRQHIYSTFSVDLVNQQVVNGNAAVASSAEGVMVGDAEAYWRKVGYRPLDTRTKRFEQRVDASGAALGGSISRAEFCKRLTWQQFSFNHFNDRFYSGTISGPLDLRVRLGIRYLHEGMLHYVEGYANAMDPSGTSTAVTVSRGLTAAQYGFSGGSHPQHTRGAEGKTRRHTEERGLFPGYLGRQRPGEKHAPVSGDAVMNELAQQLEDQQP